MLALKPDYSMAKLIEGQRVLEDRAEQFSGCHDGRDVWEKMGFKGPEKIPAVTIAELKSMREKCRGAK
jgi:hypothetical protein